MDAFRRLGRYHDDTENKMHNPSARLSSVILLFLYFVKKESMCNLFRAFPLVYTLLEKPGACIISLVLVYLRKYTST